MQPCPFPTPNSDPARWMCPPCTMWTASVRTMPIRWVSRFFSRAPKRLTSPLMDQIRRSFDEASRDEEHFPSTIDPRIYHVKLLMEHLGDLDGKRALDVGCGKGRFARIFQDRHPQAEMWGLDISDEMLKFVPAGIHTRAGSMTALPFEDG